MRTSLAVFAFFCLHAEQLCVHTRSCRCVKCRSHHGRPLSRRYAFGECYYEVTKDQAEELLEEQKDKKEAEMRVLEKELSDVRSTLHDLKSALYGRFGKNINLEE